MINFIFSRKIKFILLIIFISFTFNSNANEISYNSWHGVFVYNDYEVLKESKHNFIYQSLKLEELNHVTWTEKLNNNFKFYILKEKNIIFGLQDNGKFLKKILLDKKLLKNQYLRFEADNIHDLYHINIKSKQKLSKFINFYEIQGGIIIKDNFKKKLENIFLFSNKPIENLKVSIVTIKPDYFRENNHLILNLRDSYTNLRTKYYGESYYLKINKAVIDYLKLNTFLFYSNNTRSIILKKNKHILHDLISFYDFKKTDKKKIFIHDLKDDLYLKFVLKKSYSSKNKIKISINDNVYQIESLTVNIKNILEQNNGINLEKKSFEIDLLDNHVSSVYLFKKTERNKLSDIQNLRTIIKKNVLVSKNNNLEKEVNVLSLDKKFKINSNIPDF
jgi:hypothetical protein